MGLTEWEAEELRQESKSVDLPKFITQLQADKAARKESLYASDKVYALLDAYLALSATMATLASKEHDWTPSTLGHGYKMCRRCSITMFEADALGQKFCEPLS